MMSNIGPEHPLRKYFAGLVEQAFITEMGIAEPALTEYLGDLLTEFIHVDQIYRLRRVDGCVIREISRMEAEATLRGDVNELARKRLINRYIGDFTLFWTGLYPETLRSRRSDRLGEYLAQGKRGYIIASELSDADAEPPANLLHQLSAEFEYCVHGLHLVRENWDRLSERHN